MTIFRYIFWLVLAKPTIYNFWTLNTHPDAVVAANHCFEISDFLGMTCFTKFTSILVSGKVIPFLVSGKVIPLHNIYLLVSRSLWRSHICKGTIMRLTHFSPVSHFYTPWKRQKTKGFLTFSEAIEMWHWTKMINTANAILEESMNEHVK